MIKGVFSDNSVKFLGDSSLNLTHYYLQTVTTQPGGEIVDPSLPGASVAPPHDKSVEVNPVKSTKGEY